MCSYFLFIVSQTHHLHLILNIFLFSLYILSCILYHNSHLYLLTTNNYFSILRPFLYAYAATSNSDSDSLATCVSMETPEPGPADGEERLVELRPRTRSNPEGAEDRRSSTGSLGGNSNPNISQPAVGSRVEGEGEASTSDSPPSSTTTTVSAAAAQTAAPAVAAAAAAAAASATVPLSTTTAAAAKERPKPAQQQTPIPPPAEYQLKVPRVNCPEKVVGPHYTSDLCFI